MDRFEDMTPDDWRKVKRGLWLLAMLALSGSVILAFAFIGLATVIGWLT